MNSIVLVENGSPRAAIMVSPDAGIAERHAAEMLQRHLRNSSGAELPIVRTRPKGPLICVGRFPESERIAGNFDWHALGPDGILVRTAGDQVVLAGLEPRGTLYAVYEFLERVIDLRLLAPGVRHMEHRRTIAAPAMDIVYRPPFRYREPHFHILTDPEWAVANRANSRPCLEARHGGGISYAGHFVHNFYALVPPARYFKDHPEYYSEVKGQRTYLQAQLCLSNPDVLDIVSAECRTLLADNPRAGIITISQEDRGNWCTCAQCRARDGEEGSPAASIVAFVNAVEHRRARREVKRHVIVQRAAGR